MLTEALSTHRRPDPDELDRVCERLSLRHGDLAIDSPDDVGSVRITATDGHSWRFTAQNRLVHESRTDRKRAEGRRVID